MDESEDTAPARGFRLKWRKTAELQSVGECSDVESRNVEAKSSFDDVYDKPLDFSELAVVSDFGLDLGLHDNPSAPEDASQYEPSLGEQVFDDDVIVDVGGHSSVLDDAAAVDDQFIRGAKFSSITMPWETPLMRQIFEPDRVGPALSMPLDWGSTAMPLAAAAETGVNVPVVPSDLEWTCIKYVQHKSDDTFLQQRDKTLKSALQKWRFMILVDPACSDVGRQIMDMDETEAELVLTSVLGVKSPNTVQKRANALMLYYRWVAVNGSSTFLPFDEQDVWRYVSSLNGVSGSASRSQSLLQAMRFSHFVFGFDNALACANSRRICGQAQIQLSLKDPVKQARPLTVQEVRLLHKIADGATHSIVDKCIASNLLLLLYGRCRVSDVNFVHEILHDLTGGTGFIEISTRYHKSARSAQQKAQLLPIVMSSTGISDVPWVYAWIENRKVCGLQTSGLVDGALVPAPLIGAAVQWMKRPLSPSEVTAILKGFLQCDDSALSWAAKAEIPRDQRRVLGRHADAVKCADSFYSRDMSI